MLTQSLGLVFKVKNQKRSNNISLAEVIDEKVAMKMGGLDFRRMELGTIVFSPSISFSLPSILSPILIQIQSAEIFCVLFLTG